VKIISTSLARSRELYQNEPHDDSPLAESAGRAVDFAIRPKSFISLPFTAGISVFAVILPHPLGENSMRL
jgi:hypothetical protein